MLTDPSVCVALGDPECDMSLFICNHTITFTAAQYYWQFVTQVLILAQCSMPHSTYDMIYLVWQQDSYNCLLDISNVTWITEPMPVSPVIISVIDEKRFSKRFPP